MDLDLETGEHSVEVTSLLLTVYIVNLFFVCVPAQCMVGKPHGPDGADPAPRFQVRSCGSELAHESLVQDSG